MAAQTPSRTRTLVEYDSVRRRLWIAGQRCHHGATGAVVAGLSLAGLAVQLADPSTALSVAASGGLLMAHDWADRSMWFERGAGTQP
jgi:hypothetical protein